MSRLWDIIKHRLVQYNRDPVTGGIEKLLGPGGVGFDARAIAKWFDGGYANKTVCWWGDSTTEQMDGTQYVKGTGEWLYSANPKLAAAGVRQYNHGATGATLAALASASPLTNSLGNRCDIAAIAALKYDCYIPCFGINDCRTDATIIGSYGSAGQIAKAQALQALFVSSAAQIRAQNPNAVIVWRMPNAHVTGSAYITGGVSAQHCMDVYRLTFRGDAALGVSPLASLVSNSILYDTLSIWYNDTAYAATPISDWCDADGLHPASVWYGYLLSDICELLSTTADTEIGTSYQARVAIGNALTRFGHTIRPDSTYIDFADEYEAIGTAVAVTINGAFFDASFILGQSQAATAATTTAWGAVSGASYGATATPALHPDDVVVWTPIGKSRFVMPIRTMADANQGGYLRWYSGGPDGYYPSASQLVAGDIGVIYRRKDFGTPIFRHWKKRVSSQAVGTYPANSYGFSVVSAASGSLVVRGMPPFNGTKSMVGKTIAATDRLILSGVTPADGLLLTGLTWTAHGSEPGRGTIAVAGVDFTKHSIRQGVILSAT